MDPRTVARVHAASRVGFGAALIAAPRPVAGAWVGRDARRTSTRVYSRALGARDLGLGAGLLAQLGDATAARPWIAAAMLGDAVDLLVTLRHRDALPAFGVASVALMAGASVGVGVWLYRSLAEPGAQTP